MSNPRKKITNIALSKMIAQFDLLSVCVYFDLGYKEMIVFREILRSYFDLKKTFIDSNALIDFAKIRLSKKDVVSAFRVLVNKSILKRVIVPSKTKRIYQIDFDFLIMILKDVKLQSLITDVNRLNELVIEKMYDLFLRA